LFLFFKDICNAFKYMLFFLFIKRILKKCKFPQNYEEAQLFSTYYKQQINILEWFLEDHVTLNHRNKLHFQAVILSPLE